MLFSPLSFSSPHHLSFPFSLDVFEFPGAMHHSSTVLIVQGKYDTCVSEAATETCFKQFMKRVKAKVVTGESRCFVIVFSPTSHRLRCCHMLHLSCSLLFLSFLSSSRLQLLVDAMFV